MRLLLLEADPQERYRLLTAFQAAAPECNWTAVATVDEVEGDAFDVVVLKRAAYLDILAALTANKAIEAQLQRSQRLESLGTLAAGIAHDLNNVLTPLQLGLDLLREAKTDEARRPLEVILQSNIDRGAELVRQILLSARDPDSRSGRADQELTAREPMQVGQVLIEVERILGHGLPKGIDIKVRTPADLAPVFGDPSQVQQILLNLGYNARDAMPQGGRLTLAAVNANVGPDQARLNPPALAGAFVQLTVADTGEGMDARVMERIFDPFFTTKEPSKGTGLGLSTVFGLVKRHGGFIEVDSTVGRGSEFRVYLPAADGAALVPADVPGPPRGNGELILVIDDEEPIRNLARTMLEAFNYRVVTACHGAEGVALFAAHSADIKVVLTDMMMPVMDGPATIRALQRLDPTVRIIASSGLSSPRSAGMSGLRIRSFLQKPYSARKLLEALHAILRE